MHSRIRAYTTKYSTIDEIIREAFVIGLGYQDTNFKSFHYYLLVFEITVSTKQLPCRYSTKKIFLLINCDLYNTLLQNQYEAKVLICGHGYHIICYNAMKGRCKYCYNYYETRIKNNIKSFINKLEKGANILTEDDIDIDNNEDNKNKNNNNLVSSSLLKLEI
ncbi:hypothetical protein F8M41_004051 [Gigaspora margarita]|uniref:Uncharacterized protein n=1 Tax=Gigaspora margarita TaxID=4874 RepID=A0A8H3XCT3_GIGMA|nr:hypothetical protein F8M41_004051 [Gigaspora margarita]